MIVTIIYIYLIVCLTLMLIYCLVLLPFSTCDTSMIICESCLMGMFWPLALIALIVVICKNVINCCKYKHYERITKNINTRQ